MLNYIWSGLIIISICFALGHDLRDEWNNTYKNKIPVQLAFSASKDNSSIKLHYADKIIIAHWKSDTHSHLLIPVTEQPPESWIQNRLTDSDTELLVQITAIDFRQHLISFTLPEVHWVKLNAIIDAGFDMAKFAVTLSLGLTGIMALWLGLMQIAEKSGLIFVFVKAIYPVLRWLFPEIPRDHPALGTISLNLSANILGLGNAATPLGIKAMQQLQTLNHKKDKASNSMCMFLALNTSSVQLLPPVTLIALMGTQVSELIIPIILATSASTIAAIIAARSYARWSQ